MRAAFVRSLIEAARQDSGIYLLVGDVGYNLVEPFAEEYPDRYVNIGISEQDMVGIAAGLALSGKRVFCYSIANFPVLRCLEQIRSDVCYHNLNVTIVTGGGGLVYGSLGASHHVTEDIAVMRALPNMTVVAPGDPVESGLLTTSLSRYQGPVYLRLGRTGDPVVHKDKPDIVIGKAVRVRDGNDVTLISTGGILANTIAATKLLDDKGIRAGVFSMHTVKPLDKSAVLDTAQNCPALITVEEHNIIGGLGGAVGEILAESGASDVKFKRIGVPDEYCTVVGDQDYLRGVYSLTPEGIAETVASFIGIR